MNTIDYIEDIHYSKLLERSVLSVCIDFTEGYEVVSELLNDECFFFTETKTIWQAIREMYNEGYPIDLVSVTDFLFQKGVKVLAGDNMPYYLTKLRNDVVNAAPARYWSARLREMWAKRKMLELSRKGQDAISDPFEQANEIKEMLNTVFDIKNTDDWRDMSQVGIDLVKHMEEVEGKEMIGVSTSFKELDLLNGGFRPGDLIIIGARPSVGKSALMGRIALHAAVMGTHVGLISLEMKNKRVLARMVSLKTEVPHWRIDRSQFDEDSQRQHVLSTIAQMANLPIRMADTAELSLTDLRIKAKKLKNRGELDFLMIDYLQLITPDEKSGRNREQEVSKLSRGLKVLAMELNIPACLLAQLNRKSEERKDKKPELSDLRESGSIEQDADVVMLLHRDWHAGIKQDEHGNSTENFGDLIISKWRDGVAGISIKIGFDGDKMKFYELQKEPVFDNPYAGIKPRDPSQMNDKDAPF